MLCIVALKLTSHRKDRKMLGVKMLTIKERASLYRRLEVFTGGDCVCGYGFDGGRTEERCRSGERLSTFGKG